MKLIYHFMLLLGIFNVIPLIAFDAGLRLLQQDLESLSVHIKSMPASTVLNKNAVSALEDARNTLTKLRGQTLVPGEYVDRTEGEVLREVFGQRTDLIDAWNSQNFSAFDDETKDAWEAFREMLQDTMVAIELWSPKKEKELLKNYSITCMKSDEVSKLNSKDKAAISAIVNNGKFICAIFAIEWFGFPVLGKTGDATTDKRLGMAMRLLERDSGSKSPASVTNAFVNDYAFVVRDNTSKEIVAVGDGYLSSHRTLYPYLNFMVAQSLINEPLIVLYFFKDILNRAVSIYVNNSRQWDKTIMYSQLRLSTEIPLEGIQKMLENNPYVKNKVIEIKEDHWSNGSSIEIARVKSDKNQKPDVIVCK